MSAYLLQNAIYNKLSNDAALSSLIVGVHDNPGQVPNPESNAPFPFLTIGDTATEPFDTDSSRGFTATARVHTWSRARHHLECKQIQDAIYDALHREEIAIPGHHFVGCDMTLTDSQRDPDGITVHGVQSFNIVFERI